MSARLKPRLIALITTDGTPRAAATRTHPRQQTNKETSMNTNLKIKLIALFTTIAMFALPVADAAAHTLNWTW
jgi:hypothetical protein